MENKQNVVEKRIKPGIIRRRAKQAEPEAGAAAPEAKESAPGEQGALAKAKEAPAKKGAKKAATAKKTAKQKKEISAEPEVPAQAATAAEAATVPEAEKPSGVRGPRDLPQGPPVGTIISLPQTAKRPGMPASAEKAPKGLEEATPEEAEEDRKLRLKKLSRKGRGERDELDIEGFGRVSTVSQIARISTRRDVERVFQPVRTGKRRRSRTRREIKKTSATMPKASKRIVKMEETILVSDLAQQLGVKGGEVIKKLMDMGTMVTLNQSIDLETASIVAHEYGWETKRTGFEEAKALETAEDRPEDLVTRAPVVTVMGHVDHGKTSLLDAIRSTQVAAGEAGGITQHIGSYKLSLGEGKDVTFLDTPGHEAFTQMRARGAAVTDIVVLVVAADDGVMPQTVEAINHAKAANVPIIVAVNKIDKPDAKPDNVKRQLSEHGLLAEDWGGEVLFAHVSAKTKKGIDALLELIFLQAEVLALKANPNKPAKGVIIEARLDKGRGPVATALIQEGTLRLGDNVVAGNYFGRVRAMVNDRGENVTEAGPGVPVEVLGIEDVPQASDLIQSLATEKDAREVVEHRQIKARQEKMTASSKMSLEELFNKMQSGEVKELGLILKADVQGSVEALQGALQKLPSDKVKIRVLHSGVGGITESDVMLANASNGVIIGFNVRPDTKAIEVATREGVDIKGYKVIYDVIEDVRKAMEGLLEPLYKEIYLGRAEIRQTFAVSKLGTAAGCSVVDGKILSNANVRLLRDNVIIHEGKLASLKRFKDDVREVVQGYECGMGIEGYNDLKEGDVIECYKTEQVKAKLE
jgi:translation initiation factor IF-2